MNKRTWWRAAAALIVCVAAVGSWFGMVHAQPIPKVENAVWSRSTAAIVDPAPVTQALATSPTVPMTLPVSTPPPPLAKPAASDQVLAPGFKAVPAKPAARPSFEDQVQPPAELPILPSTSKSSPPKPVIPAIPELAPPAQPLKSAEPVKPLPPGSPDFNLRPGDAANSFKPGAVPPTLPVIPPTLPMAPPFSSATRPKPIDGPMPATEKFVFAIPSHPGIPAVNVKPVLPVAPEDIEPPMPKPDSLTAIPTPGAEPMKPKQATIATVIGGALAMMASAPASAVPLPPKTMVPAIAAPVLPARPVAADPPAKTVDEKLSDIDKKLGDLTELLKGKKDAQGFTLPSDPGIVAEIKNLKNELAEMKKLKDEVASLKLQLETLQKSTSLKPSLSVPLDPMAGKSIVRVVNDYPVEITLVVNNSSYRVAPNTKLDITVPMGDFTYQLLNATAPLAPVKSPIKEKEIVTLRIK